MATDKAMFDRLVARMNEADQAQRGWTMNEMLAFSASEVAAALALAEQEKQALRARIEVQDAALARWKHDFSAAEATHAEEARRLNAEVERRDAALREANSQLSCVVAAIETHPLNQVNNFIEMERLRARKYLEAADAEGAAGK